MSSKNKRRGCWEVAQQLRAFPVLAEDSGLSSFYLLPTTTCNPGSGAQIPFWPPSVLTHTRAITHIKTERRQMKGFLYSFKRETERTNRGFRKLAEFGGRGLCKQRLETKARVCNSRNHETETGGSQVQGLPGQLVRIPCFKIQKIKGLRE